MQDFSYDWEKPDASPIFTAAYGLDVAIGGDCRYRRQLGTPHCLKRGYTPGSFAKLSSQDYVHLLVSSTDNFPQFTDLLEKSVHNPVHVALGGDMNTAAAPNDPIFWLLHGHIDKIWADWQAQRNSMNLTKAETTTLLAPFNITALYAESIVNLCYQYQPFSRGKHSKPLPQQ